MKRVSFTFILLGFFSLLFADLEIINLNPWREMTYMLKGLFSPRLSILLTLKNAIVNTLVFAFCGVTLGLLAGVLFAPLYKLALFQTFFTLVRSIHEIFWAFIFLPILGLNATCGVLAIALPYSAIFAKRFYEIYRETDLRAYEELPANSNKIIRFLYGAFPLLYKNIQEFSFYRLECAIRSSAILGFIGLPTLGFHLESYFNEGKYSEAMAILLLFYFIIGTKKYWLKIKLFPVYSIISFIIISKSIHLVPSNIVRFFTYDIMPWPMRKEGFVSGKYTLNWEPVETFQWFTKIFKEEIIGGAKETLILSQITLLFSGLLSVIFLAFIIQKINKPIIRKLNKMVLVILRSTPEYIIAYVAIQLWGPSMLPGIIALVLHNGAIITMLTIKSADSIKLPLDIGKGRISSYLFHILPQIYSTFLGNLFYRWEAVIRESSILGILGIYTLGFYVDSAISDDKMDKAIILILFMSIINILIDKISSRVRHSIKK